MPHDGGDTIDMDTYQAARQLDASDPPNAPSREPLGDGFCKVWIIIRDKLVRRKYWRIGRQRDEKENEEDNSVAANKGAQLVEYSSVELWIGVYDRRRQGSPIYGAVFPIIVADLMRGYFSAAFSAPTPSNNCTRTSQ
jgi:hypothetical protein